MARPKHEQPTPAELEVLKILWDRVQPASVRDMLEALNDQAGPPRAYTTVMSLLNVMTDKGLLNRTPHGRAFLYEPAIGRDRTLAALLDETLRRVFDGSASQLVAHLLDRSTTTAEELAEIRALIAAHKPAAKRQGGR